MKYGIRSPEGDPHTAYRYYQCHADGLLDEPHGDENDEGFIVEVLDDRRAIFRTVTRPWQLGRDITRTGLPSGPAPPLPGQTRQRRDW